MIHFTCEHCGSPVRVPDAARGQKGRCPSCQKIVVIPEASTTRAAVPPPPGTTQPSLEELDLSLPAQDLSDETQILPSPEPAGRKHRSRSSRRRKIAAAMNAPAKPWAMVMMIIVIAAILTAAIVWWLMPR